ncbi:MAG: redox-regulated ATPase YchF, partial [Acidimicrobiales bacterium]
MDRLGLVGLPNSGKSALFNALTGGDALVASHAFSTTETEIGVAHVPDPRLDALAKMSESKRVVPAAFEVVDIAGVQKSAEGSDGLGSRFLAGVREVDALALVLRSFVDDSAPGETDPRSALESLELELVLADAGSLESQLSKRKKRAPLEPNLAAALEVAPRALEILEAGTPLYASKLPPAGTAALRPLFLLTTKPLVVVVNIGEGAVGSSDATVGEIKAHLGDAAEVLAVSVQLESEASRLEEGERQEMLEGLGLGEGALLRVARAAWQILGRQTFLTTGDKESRAWMFRSGSKAPECAGVIHSDLQRGFIKADVIAWDELLAAGSFAAARSKGKVRLEGKDYVVKDGDVLEIRFN